MKLPVFISQHHDEIIGRWSKKVSERLGLDPTSKPVLLNDMPEFLTDLTHGLEQASEDWTSSTARTHARQRIALGVDIGGLSEEIGIVGETILELADEHRCELRARDTAAMVRILARGTAESVTEYARLRDQELTKQAAAHFSFVAHELRTPLQTASIASALLEETAPSPVVERLQRALSQLRTLIDNSLVEARLTAEPLVQKEPVPVRALVDAALQNGEALAERQGIRLASETEDFEIDADRKLMVSALTNLVINGIKFSKPDGTVRVRVRRKQQRVHFEVEDACGGLSETALPKLFQPFGQDDADRSGFGLGLLIVKQAVEANSGTVRVVNHPGHGCCFVIELPRNHSRARES